MLRPNDYYDQLFPEVSKVNWQMQPNERIALAGLLSRLRPKLSIEVGIYWGGSLSLTSQYADRIIAIDIDPAVRERFLVPRNVEIRIGDSGIILKNLLDEVRAARDPLSFVFIDADHSSEGVRRDIDCVLEYVPIVPMTILMHDSGNPDCRRGILSADWEKNRHVQFVECDFVPGQVIEHTVVDDSQGEVWGGFALAYLTPDIRAGAVCISEGARSSVAAAHAFTQGRIVPPEALR
jgi:hypothetical protein